MPSVAGGLVEHIDGAAEGRVEIDIQFEMNLDVAAREGRTRVSAADGDIRVGIVVGRLRVVATIGEAGHPNVAVVITSSRHAKVRLLRPNERGAIVVNVRPRRVEVPVVCVRHAVRHIRRDVMDEDLQVALWEVVATVGRDVRDPHNLCAVAGDLGIHRQPCARVLITASALQVIREATVADAVRVARGRAARLASGHAIGVDVVDERRHAEDAVVEVDVVRGRVGRAAKLELAVGAMGRCHGKVAHISDIAPIAGY